MARGLRWVTHNDFSKGMCQDTPLYLIPDGFVFEARNMMVTKAGQLKKRQGNARHTTDISGIVPTSIATARNYFNQTPTDRGYLAFPKTGSGNNTAFFTSFVTAEAQSALTPSAGLDSYIKGTAGIPTSWSGHSIFPMAAPNALAVGTNSPLAFVGGSQLGMNANSSPFATGNCTVTANSDQITITNASSGARAGDYIFCTIAGTQEYVGRIKEVISTTAFRVEPTPTASFTATSGTIKSILEVTGSRTESGTTVPVGAGCVAVHQDRIVLGNVFTTTLGASGKGNTIQWSTFLNVPVDSPVTAVDGYVPFLKAGWPRRNYQTFPNMNTVVSIVSLGPSTLLILGDNGVSLVSGNLPTTTADTTTTNYTVRVLSTSIGCISAASVQITPAGVMFAAEDGIYVTDGNTFTNVTQNKIRQTWVRGLSLGMTVGGSALLENNIYVISTTIQSSELGGTFFCDIANGFAFTRTYAPNAQSLPFRMSARDPDPTSNRVYVIGTYTDVTVCKNPQLLRLDTIFPRDYSFFVLDQSVLDGSDVLGAGDTTGIIDANNQKVIGRVQTKAYTEGDPTMIRRFRHSQFLTSVQDNDLANSGLYASYIMGTNPDYSWASANRWTLGSVTRPTALAGTNQAFKTRFDTNMNAQAISYVLSDNNSAVGGTSLPSWTLYEVTTATNELRAGRNGNQLTPDATSTNVGAGTVGN